VRRGPWKRSSRRSARWLTTMASAIFYFVDDILSISPSITPNSSAGPMAAAKLGQAGRLINPGLPAPPAYSSAMLDAGCDALEFGTDSGAPVDARFLGKSFTVDTVRESSRPLPERGVDFAHYIIFGGPGRDRGNSWRDLRPEDELQPTAVIGMTGIRISRAPNCTAVRW